MDANREEILERFTRLAKLLTSIQKAHAPPTKSRRRSSKARMQRHLENEIQQKEEELLKLKEWAKPVNDNESDMDLKQVP